MKTSITNYIISFIAIVSASVLYNWYEEKQLKMKEMNDYTDIQKYLLSDEDLGKSVKPILWIHIPYEYNSRNWISFGSRTSLELNQPYLYLTIKSIIMKCDESFKICVIDDTSFEKLIPGWNINMKTISRPIITNMRELGMMKLLYMYGGMICPCSFLCMRNLIGMYEKGTRTGNMFICENNDRSVSSTETQFIPDISFCGSPKENYEVKELTHFIQHIISTDYTAESRFLNEIGQWCLRKIKMGKIVLINGIEIGVKCENSRPIKIEDLMSSNYLDLSSETYGIFIPARDILMRRQYEWFARLSEKQVLESDTIIGKYMLINVGSGVRNGRANFVEPLQNKPEKWVGFWKTPNVSLYGQKPNFLGDNILVEKYPNY